MKKIIISGLALGSCLLLASCGTSNEGAVITNLSNQLDRLNNVVANSVVIDTNQINLTNYTNEEDTGAIRNIYQKTEASINKQNHFKELIKEKTASIKQFLEAKEIKLGKNTNAIKDLANSLSKYTTKLANTNNEFKKTAKTISKMKNNVKTSTSDLGAKLTKLSSCSDTRSCYYNNLLNTLNQIDNLLNGGANVQDNILNNDYLNNYLMQKNNTCLYDTNGNALQGSYCQNGTCYDSNGNAMTGYYFDADGNCVNGNCVPNKAYFSNQNLTNNQYQNNNQNILNNNNFQNQNLSNYSNRNLQNNNYVNNLRNRQFERFNPSRNTDTYAPNTNNIDTYRGNPNSYAYNHTLNQSEIDNNVLSENSEITNKTIETSNSQSLDNKINDNKQTMTENSASDNTQKENENILNNENVSITNNTNSASPETTNNKQISTTSNKQINQIETIKNKPMLSNEDGRDDVSPKSKNLRFSERITNSNENIAKKNKSASSSTQSTINLQPDYKQSNKKIKDLIQGDALTTESFNHFNIGI